MPIFEASAVDPLGLWDSTSPAVSFGLAEAESNSSEPDVPLYRLNLPADPAAAQDVFRSSAAAFEQVSAALESLPARFDNLSARKKADGVSFEAAAPEPGPEGDLLSLLALADREGALVNAEGQASFGLNEVESSALGVARTQFETFLAQIEREMLHLAWVETQAANQLIARTIVAWSGSAQTVWNANLAPEQIALHQQSLQFATQTRLLHLRLFVTVTSGAAKLAGLMAAPGGAVLALPVAYQYVTSVVAQARKLQALQTS